MGSFQKGHNIRPTPVPLQGRSSLTTVPDHSGTPRGSHKMPSSAERNTHPSLRSICTPEVLRVLLSLQASQHITPSALGPIPHLSCAGKFLTSSDCSDWLLVAIEMLALFLLDWGQVCSQVFWYRVSPSLGPASACLGPSWNGYTFYLWREPKLRLLFPRMNGWCPLRNRQAYRTSMISDTPEDLPSCSWPWGLWEIRRFCGNNEGGRWGTDFRAAPVCFLR